MPKGTLTADVERCRFCSPSQLLSFRNHGLIKKPLILTDYLESMDYTD